MPISADTHGGTKHCVTYWIPFWDEPVVADCICGLGEDHVEVTPVLGTETAAAFVRRVRAWFRKEPRQ